MQPGMAPELPRWYREPREVAVRIEKIEKGPFPEEVAISVRLNGESQTALVPAATIDENKKTVTALLIGEYANYALVALPASSMGRIFGDV